MVCADLIGIAFKKLCQTQQIMKKLIISFLILLATIVAVWAQAPISGTTAAGWRISEGKIQRSFGKNWDTVEIPTAMPMTGLHFLAENYGWAVGQNATILRWDGERWSEVLVFTNENLTAVFLKSEMEGWAVGNQGTILQWDGVSWKEQPSPLSETLISVGLSPTGSVQIVSKSGNTLVREAGDWKVQPASTSQLTASVKQLE